MLEPAANKMSRAAVKVTVPVPLTPMSLLAAEKLIFVAEVLPANADKLLSAAKVTAPANVTVLSGLAAEPIVRLALKSGKGLTVSVSLAFPRLIVSEPLGLLNVV